MPQSLTKLFVHIIFSTKNRDPLLTDKKIRKAVHDYLADVCRKHSCPALEVGGVSDHVHILCSLSKSIAIKDLVQQIKQDSSFWVKKQWPRFNYFYWQNGYGAFSVSPLHVKQVQEYIANQEEHHREVGFEDEFRAFLQRYQIAYDERFVWG